MALSDYLTDAEWDACYYAWGGQHGGCNFGASMHKTIDTLLETGYRFPGLTESGDKLQQLQSDNPKKLCMIMGLGVKPTPEGLMKIFESGRDFLKVHCPALVDETDEEWESQKAVAAASS